MKDFCQKAPHQTRRDFAHLVPQLQLTLFDLRLRMHLGTPVIPDCSVNASHNQNLIACTDQFAAAVPCRGQWATRTLTVRGFLSVTTQLITLSCSKKGPPPLGQPLSCLLTNLQPLAAFDVNDGMDITVCPQVRCQTVPGWSPPCASSSQRRGARRCTAIPWLGCWPATRLSNSSLPSTTCVCNGRHWVTTQLARAGVSCMVNLLTRVHCERQLASRHTMTPMI